MINAKLKSNRCHTKLARKYVVARRGEKDEVELQNKSVFSLPLLWCLCMLFMHGNTVRSLVEGILYLGYRRRQLHALFGIVESGGSAEWACSLGFMVGLSITQMRGAEFLLRRCVCNIP